jgi:acetyltransferase
LLRKYGIRSPQSIVCKSGAEAQSAFASMTKPIVVKVMDAAITHKTEVGGVHLNIHNVDQLRNALTRIDTIPGNRDARGYLLEEMAGSGVDLILGARRDPSYGPTLLVGLGGVEAEVLKDVSIRMVPLTRIDAEAMLSELRGNALLDGWRGSPAADRSAIADAMLAAAELLASQPQLLELDINPLRCSANGVLALDALMIWKDTP